MANNNQIYKMSNAGGFKSLTRYYDMLAGNTTWNPWSPTGAYDALATVTVPSGGVSSIEFAGIPSTYKHLQIRAILGTTSGSNYIGMTFNGVGGSSYSGHVLWGNGSTTGANTGYGQSASSIYAGTAATSSGYYAGTIIDVLDYTNGNKYKTTRQIMGVDQNGSGGVEIISGLFMSTSAISSITLSGSVTIPQYSSFALYGIR